ncbi:UNVERIFIED_CONTAM: SNF2 domain-containing protein CLASSY 3 [Sesamum radiatum]|uniref:SNF2 domain-containing protein CLASSY 3 n=1 Tax=Sesamum radiatum TaxID=300843 RepID=A0AAW2RBD4_SESRA
MRDCLVILRPTDLQRKLLQNVAQVDKFLEQAYLASLISVHPSLVADKPEFSDHKRKLKSLASDPNAGVKTRFLIKLIQLSMHLHEKVLVFSEFIDPLLHIKNLLKSHFSWNEGREIIYMDGDKGIKQRQHLINSFNDKHGEAKVLLASKELAQKEKLSRGVEVVLLDVVWNPSVERQAICRAYRLGQEKMVYVYHVMTLMEVKKYARQAEKERISELIFPSPDGGGDGGRRLGCDEVVSEDKVLEAMVGHQSFGSVFERIVHQPKESDLVNTFGFVDLKQ